MSQQIGATALGLKAREGVVLAADRRMSYGGFVLSRNARKVFVVAGRFGVAFAGLYADMSGILRLLEAEVKFYETRVSGKLSVRGVAKLLSNILYSSKFFPYMIEVIVGGVEDGRPSIYVVDPVGAITEEDFVAVGSGASTALGLLEAEYKPGISVEEAKKLAVRALRAAMSRDAGTGDGIDVLALTRGGYTLETHRFRLAEG